MVLVRVNHYSHEMLFGIMMTKRIEHLMVPKKTSPLIVVPQMVWNKYDCPKQL